MSALKSVAKIHKPFEKSFMDKMKLFMVTDYKLSPNRLIWLLFLTTYIGRENRKTWSSNVF